MKSDNDSASVPRLGFGYDVHRLVAGRKLVLGGVDIPFSKGLEGHSDADVLLHAMADAVLGAAALGDIGKHFPNTDPRYKNISSMILLRQVADLLARHHYALVNIDATVVAEQPVLAPFIDAMRRNVAGAFNVSADRVSVKATTNEGMGFVGRGEGICAHAVASITVSE